MADFPTITDLRGLPDPLLQYRWTLIIPNVPGGGDGRRLQYQCKTSSIPGLSNEEVVVTSHGIDLQFAGRQMYGQSFPATFFETRDLLVYTTLRNWLDYQRNSRAGTGTYKANYATSAQMLLFDDALKVVNTLNLEGFFIQDLSEASVDGGSSAPVEFSATFKFDVSYLS
jgi:hypothetical protein